VTPGATDAHPQASGKNWQSGHGQDVTMRPLKRQPPRTKIERLAARRAQRIRIGLGEDIRQAREDAGISLSSLARAAGVSKSHVHAIETGLCEPKLETAARVGGALGLDLSVRFYPGTGPLVRDHLQAAMVEALLNVLHERWRRSLEVAVYQPVRGVIDLMLETEGEPLVACEAQSELRRLEQQLRWSRTKADALAEARGRPVSSLLLLRSTRRNRAVVSEFAATVRAAFPASTSSALGSLSGASAWPGGAVLWCEIEQGQARVLARPPRNVAVGR
jgi:transcriptional regulator with XRE-family HTH domain